MLQHPYARSLSPTPEPLMDSIPVRRTSSARPATSSGRDRPRLGRLVVQKPSASETDLRPSAISAMSLLGPQHRKHFVKQENSITLVLSGHSGAAEKPVYTSGSIVRGLVTLSRAESIASVVVNLEGALKVRELQGGGVGTSPFLSETLYTWNSTPHRTVAPSEFNFEMMMPIFVPPAGDRRLLPPSYDSRLSAIPGFRVTVQYEFVVSVTRHTGPMEFWKKRTRLRVPFVYKPLTRPQALGPFPASVSRESSEHPQTLFLDAIRPHHPKLPVIEVQLFLPQSQVIPSGECINFRLALRAPDSYLAPLLHSSATAQPLASFLPIPSLSSGGTRSFDTASDSAPSLKLKSVRQPRFALRLFESTPGRQPISVWLERRVTVNARETGVFVLGWGPRGRQFTATEVVAEAQLHHEKRESGRVKWWGTIDIPANTGCAGFSADRLSVEDFLVVSIDVPGMSTHDYPFQQTIPVRLTSHSARAVAAVKVGSL